MKYIDNFLNKITMYKLVLYGLFALSFIAIIFGFTGLIYYSGLSLVYSFFALTITCFVSNEIFARIFKVQTNVESSSITALILFLIIFPIETWGDLKLTLLVGVLAMLSKYILAIKKKHVFNPAAISLVILGLFGIGLGLWWVGSAVMLIPTAVLGFLVLRKVRRFSLFFAYFIAAVISITTVSIVKDLDTAYTLRHLLTSWPIIFFGTIMLTEPLTTPPTRKLQVLYGLLVGGLFGLQFHIGILNATPELALVIGNLFSYIISPRARLVLTLVQKNKITNDVYDFIFKSDEKLKFKPGQYLEWTLGHKNPDARGNRRYFTISSSPTEENIHLGSKFYPMPSSFKKKLMSLELGDKIIASQLSGEFTMPKDVKKKLVFIAGGIGSTPFRSMAKYELDTKETRDVVFFYSNKTPQDIAYKDIFDKAEREVGWKNIYVVNEPGGDFVANNVRTGFITPEMIIKEVPDYKDRMYYISGTHGMVTSFQASLQKLGIKRSNIKVDFFPGFV